MPATNLVGKTSAADDRLDRVLLRLQQVQSAVVVAVAALKYQSCELDEDIATVLQRQVADGIQEQIDTLETIARRVSSRDPKS